MMGKITLPGLYFVEPHSMTSACTIAITMTMFVEVLLSTETYVTSKALTVHKNNKKLAPEILFF